MEKKIKGAKSLFRPLEEYDFGKSVVTFGKKKFIQCKFSFDKELCQESIGRTSENLRFCSDR